MSVANLRPQEISDTHVVIGAWRIECTKQRMASSEETAAALHSASSVPEMLFLRSGFRISRSDAPDASVAWTAAGALASCLPEAWLQVSCAAQWREARSHVLRGADSADSPHASPNASPHESPNASPHASPHASPQASPRWTPVESYDWTYSPQNYRGEASNRVRVEAVAHGATDVEAELGRITALMKRTVDPILFFSEVTLFEDELHDHGISRLIVRVRVMPHSFLCLLRHFLRVDGVHVRVQDVRLMGDVRQPWLFRECTLRSFDIATPPAGFDSTVAAALSDTSPLLLEIPMQSATLERVFFGAADAETVR